MPSHPAFANIGAFVSFKQSAHATAVAAGAGDNTETSGTGVDRYVNGSNGADGIYNSAVFVLLASATLSSGKKATFKATLQASAALGSGYADVAADLQPEGAADSTVLTLAYVTGSEEGKYTHDLDLSSLDRYIRSQVHVDLDAAGTDVAEFQSGFIMGGATTIPVA